MCKPSIVVAYPVSEYQKAGSAFKNPNGTDPRFTAEAVTNTLAGVRPYGNVRGPSPRFLEDCPDLEGVLCSPNPTWTSTFIPQGVANLHPTQASVPGTPKRGCTRPRTSS